MKIWLATKLLEMAASILESTPTQIEKVECPKDLSQWVNSDPKIVWFLYDLNLLPETIRTKYHVCGLRGFQRGWQAREKVEAKKNAG